MLQDLENLQALDLSSNSISDISMLKNLKNLQDLYLSSNNISDISILKDLKYLQFLDLSSNYISDTSIPQTLENLQFLDLRSNYISDISHLLPLIRSGIPIKLKYERREGIFLDAGPITTPPIETVKKGNTAILRYFGE